MDETKIGNSPVIRGFVALMLSCTLVAAACGGADRSRSSLESAPDDVAMVLESLISDAESADGFGPASSPLLLGLDAAAIAAALPTVPQFSIEGLPQQEPPSGPVFGQPYPFAVARDEASESSAPDSASGTDEAASSTGAQTDSLAGTDAAAAVPLLGQASDDPKPVLGEGEEDTASETAYYPAPPKAADPRPPGYDNPSDGIVAASGRPIELLLGSPDSDQMTTRGVTDDSIVVGGIATQTIASLPERQAACAGAAARALQANTHLELSRDIIFTGCIDDEGRSTFGASAVQELLDDDTFAIVPVSSAAFLDDVTLNNDRVPYVGSDALPGFCGRATLFGFGVHGAAGCPVLEARGYRSVVQPVLSVWTETLPDIAGSVVIAVEDSPAGASRAAQRRFEAELLGLDMITTASVLPSAKFGLPLDWAPTARQLLADGPGAIILDGSVYEGLPAALRSAGFRGDLVIVDTLDPVAIADGPTRSALAPATVISPGLDLASRDTAGWKAMQGAAAAVGIPAHGITLDFVEGYLAMDFFIQAVAATPEPFSAEALHDTVNSGWWYPGVDGVACGTWWPASHFIEAPCVSVSRITANVVTMQPVTGLVETVPQIEFVLPKTGS